MINDHLSKSEKPEDGIEDVDSDRKKEPTSLSRTGYRHAAHTAECPPPQRVRGTPDVNEVPAGRPDRWASLRENLTGATRTGARPTRRKVTFQ